MALRIHIQHNDDGTLTVNELTPLSEQELAVLAYIPGHTNKQIAELLGISMATARGHVSTILYKLGVQSRTEAAVLALLHGWI